MARILTLIAIITSASSMITPAPRIVQRQDIPLTTDYCDNNAVLNCAPPATCYSGTPDPSTGQYVGCCSVESCAVRTTCVPYSEFQTETSTCDPNTGGCVLCTDSAAPDCFFFTNGEASQHAMWCTSPTDDVLSTRSDFSNTDVGSTTAELPLVTLYPTSIDPSPSRPPSMTMHFTPAAIAGITLGSLAAVIIPLGCCLWLLGRRRSKKLRARSPDEAAQAGRQGRPASSSREKITIMESPNNATATHPAQGATVFESGGRPVTSVTQQQSPLRGQTVTSPAMATTAFSPRPAEMHTQVVSPEQHGGHGQQGQVVKVVPSGQGRGGSAAGTSQVHRTHDGVNDSFSYTAYASGVSAMTGSAELP